MSTVWVAEHHVDGVLHGRVGRDGEDVVAEWISVATLRARRDGSDVRFVPTAGADPAMVEKVRQGSAHALVRQLRGELALHGSAVALGGRAVGIFGAGEAGKSTLAASLCLRRGASLVADDVMALEREADGFALLPFEVDHWLDADARRALGLVVESARDDKAPVRAAAVPAGCVPLVALVHARFVDGIEPRVVRVRGIEAVARLLPQLVRFVVDDPALQRIELEAIAALVDRVPIFCLERPRRIELLETTTSLVVDLAKVKP